MPDDEARAVADRLKQMVERGTYNQLADALIRMSRKHKKEPIPTIKIVEQLEDLDTRYSQPQKTQPTASHIANNTAEIVLPETFKEKI